ncbi:RNA-binding motif protein 14b [Anaeramoeba flamelloides]|uniref:RNA-binding motif protein 14b n=1 Tax=Anaeramoeba flamelloides TaxID=1746091 RepID=A0AAV7ZYK9_9EUKA|nr:RNA-binding motif protein 14b [Anaeramoeba flamelloides]
MTDSNSKNQKGTSIEDNLKNLFAKRKKQSNQKKDQTEKNIRKRSELPPLEKPKSTLTNLEKIEKAKRLLLAENKSSIASNTNLKKKRRVRRTRKIDNRPAKPSTYTRVTTNKKTIIESENEDENENEKEKEKQKQKIEKEKQFKDESRYENENRYKNEKEKETQKIINENEKEKNNDKYEENNFNKENVRPQNETSSTIYIGELKRGCTENELVNLFRSYGVIDNIKIFQKAKSYAFLKFSDPKSAAVAIEEMNNYSFQDAKLRVSRAKLNSIVTGASDYQQKVESTGGKPKRNYKKKRSSIPQLPAFMKGDNVPFEYSKEKAFQPVPVISYRRGVKPKTVDQDDVIHELEKMQKERRISKYDDI